MIDWDALHALAKEAVRTAYAPYSGYPVGAAGVTTDGRLVSGCNVENASIGVGTCAECGMVSELVRTGGGRLAGVFCVNGNDEPVGPCGRCRQILFEFGGNDLLVYMPDGPQPMSKLLPYGFGPADMAEVPGALNVVSHTATGVETEAKET